MTRVDRLSRTTRVALCAATVAFCGCASSGSPSSQGAPRAAPSRDHNSISAAEMQGLNTVNLLEVVQRLHPEWLAQRNSSTSGKSKGLSMSSDTDVSVYIGDQRAGNSQFLRSLTMGSASMLRYYNASEAQVRFGTGNFNGVIQVITSPSS